MIPELGHFALILAMLLAAIQAFFGIAGPALKRERWMAATIPAVAGQFVMVGLAFICLAAAFVMHDFSVRYVALNSNSALPLVYRIAAVWGQHEGSLILWIFLLAGWTVAVTIFSKRLPRDFATRVLGVLGFISFGFLLFTIATSNPFLRLEPPAVDGRDLNPLLQDKGMIMHPPLLYTGYVGLAVAFSFACAAMLQGKLDQAWARWTRPWTTAAWAFLTVGITVGSWWAYYELGWGGWWMWDPVENASFMPWIVATALIHSLAVTDKRGLFKSWTLLLAILAFSLSMLGTFLVRAGLTVSVHSFAADPTRGVFILAFLAIMIGTALVLYMWRAPLLKSNAGFEFGARESFLLFNNILLVIAAATVFGGTLAPTFSEALGFGPLSVGAPYFEPTFMLPILPLLALLAVGLHANWKRGHLERRKREVLGSLVIALALALAIVLGVFSEGGILTVVGITLGAWIILSSLIDPIDRIRRKLTLSRAVVGMSIAHIALGVFVLCVSVVNTYTQERDIALGSGESATVGEYTFLFNGVKDAEGPNYGAVRGEIVVTRGGDKVATLYPEKRLYYATDTVMTEAGIVNHRGNDLLVAMGEDLGQGRWSIRAQVRPLIDYVWLSAYIMALAGVWAALDRRYRTARVSEAEPATAAAPADAGKLTEQPG